MNATLNAVGGLLAILLLGYLIYALLNAEHGRRPDGHRLQYLGLLRHEHQLAVLRRRVDDGPPHPDGRAGGPELPPNAFTNWFQLLLIPSIPVALTRTFGRLVGDCRQGLAILATMSLFAVAWLVAVFVAGLMAGRTPEYLKKKITARELKLVALYLLATPFAVLVGTALAMAIPSARGGRGLVERRGHSRGA